MTPADTARLAEIRARLATLYATADVPAYGDMGFLLRLLDEATGWRDIETAPTDGTSVLIADADGFVCEAQFEPEGLIRGWYRANMYSTDYVDGQVYPTRWMPLPPPPEIPHSDPDGSPGDLAQRERS